LQQILLYRALGLPLATIRAVLSAPDFDRAAALTHHLAELTHREEQLRLLIGNVRRTIAAEKGETNMENRDKFAGLREDYLADAERYGDEVRAQY
ncbi:MerR family DNA-binding protein, partial [Clostridium perfringens]|uniref:MerR family DNA-binding protein n=1 Tax=Clostridium perfringens TaxID=1502 RepID=UPI003753EF03